MATAEQIRANRLNAQKSTGPKNTDVTRYNGLTHGLCATQLVVPGESLEACEAERRGWHGDWQPLTHTRAVLVERAFVASWKLRRATRVEGTLMSEKAADVAHDFDEQRRVLVASATHNLPIDPAYSLSRFRSDVAGLNHLIGFWEELAQAVESGWTSRADHHDRLMNLLGHKAASAPADLEAARASTALLAGPAPAAATLLRSLCDGRIADLRAQPQYLRRRLPEYRARLMDLAIAPTSKEAQLLHRYEREHEKALYAAIRGLLALEKSGADLPEPIEPEPAAEPEAVAAAPAGTGSPGESNTKHYEKISYGKLASVGGATPASVRPVPLAGSPGRPGGPTGAADGAGKAPNPR